MKRLWMIIIAVMPMPLMGAVDVSAIKKAADLDAAKAAYQAAINAQVNQYRDKVPSEYITQVTDKASENMSITADQVKSAGEEEETDTATDTESKASSDTSAAEAAEKPDGESADERAKRQSEAKSKVDDLKAEAAAAKEKEQSFENRMLSGAAMGAGGQGGQMMSAAMAEQNADKEAEEQMAAYIATMHCKYGDTNIEYGQEEVVLPGVEEMIGLKQEYLSLVTSLKEAKESLGIRPGVESDEIIEAATSGLYDDVALGKTGGAYTSVFKALTDEDSDDAKQWQAQKDKSKSDVKTGGTTAGVGIAGGAVGNLLMNVGGKGGGDSDGLGKAANLLKNVTGK